MATLQLWPSARGNYDKSFQSIGVTKEWRPGAFGNYTMSGMGSFQSIGVTKEWRLCKPPDLKSRQRLPRFQSIGVTKEWRRGTPAPGPRQAPQCFQSIGVTKEWRHYTKYAKVSRHRGFQSIGVTKEWRRAGMKASWVCIDRAFPINRRHQRMATSWQQSGCTVPVL